ncbi:MAG: hypothetical protein KC731_39810, partial [Myxococcales bacterium]|nr:hypothetical protein [Myxococcales bacterium]
RGAALGWGLAALGAATGILALQDQLTQSAYLFGCAVAALFAHAGSEAERPARLGPGLRHAIRGLTLVVYLLAGLHKLNRDFFDPSVSCATAGLAALVGEGQATPLWSEAWVAQRAWPIAFVALELSLPIWLALRPGLGVVLLALFHLPLTIIFAPGFAFTMLTGWLAFLGEPELEALRRTARRHPVLVLAIGGAGAALSRALFFPGRWGRDPDWVIKEAILWLIATWLVVTAATSRPRAFTGRAVWRSSRPLASTRFAWAAAALFLLHGLTPYLGLGFHRTGAMLSNLRIDRGCHNSLLFPEALRLADPYVVVDRIDFAPGRADPAYADTVTERLWSIAALERAREHWCKKHPEPLAMEGRHEGRAFAVADLCKEGLPFATPWFAGMRRFQVNLTRHCPQRCVH